MYVLLIACVVSLIVTGMGLAHLFIHVCKVGYRREGIPVVGTFLFTGLLIGYTIGVYSGQYDLLKNKAAYFKPVITTTLVDHKETTIGIFRSDTSYSVTLDRLPILYPRLTGTKKKITLDGDTLSVQAQFIYF